MDGEEEPVASESVGTVLSVGEGISLEVGVLEGCNNRGDWIVSHVSAVGVGRVER